MTTAIYFLHGLDSSGQGTKGRFFTEQFPGKINCPNFEGSLDERLSQLSDICTGQDELIFIGSSFGGLMATRFAIDFPDRVCKLFLLAPALNYGAYQPPKQLVSCPTLLVIGKHDTVTPPALVLPLARKTFSNLKELVENDDHFLHQSFQKLAWQELLDL